MLFSNYLDNVPKFSEFADSLSIERCYQSMCHRLKSSSLACTGYAAFGQGQSLAQTKHQLHRNHNRIRWKSRHQAQMPNRRRQTHPKPAHQRTLMPISMNAVVLFFIVLLSHDQMTTVYGARSRDSFNSIYQSNNHSVNNSNASAAIDSNIVVENHLEDELPAIDFDYVANVTDDADFERFLSKMEYSNNRKLKRSTIYQNEFAVYIPSGVDTADSIAAKHGFSNMGQVSFV